MTRTDIAVSPEDSRPTRSERTLALLLALFLLVGTAWFYVKVADWVAPDPQITSAQQQILDERDAAWVARDQSEQQLTAARGAFDVAKANVDVAAQNGSSTTTLTAAYETARADLAKAQAAATEAAQRSTSADTAAAEVEESTYSGERSTGQEWAIALLRLAFIAVWLAASLVLIKRLRESLPRYLALGVATLTAGEVMVAVFAIDYLSDAIDLIDLGPLLLSIIGAVITVIAFIALQRWWSARLPAWRVRRGECGECGYPVNDGDVHCEGCGHAVRMACGSCGDLRRVGAPHCAACGAV